MGWLEMLESRLQKKFSSGDNGIHGCTEHYSVIEAGDTKMKKMHPLPSRVFMVVQRTDMLMNVCTMG